MAVMKARAWMINQRQRRQARDPGIRRDRIVDRRAQSFRIGATDRAAMKIAIRQTGAMCQQIAKSDRTLRLLGLIEWGIRVAQHPHAG